MPRRVLTPEQIASIPGRIAAGEGPVVIAADLGVSRTTVLYQAGDFRRRRILGADWRPHISAARRALRVGDYATAATAYQAAAAACAARVPSGS